MKDYPPHIWFIHSYPPYMAGKRIDDFENFSANGQDLSQLVALLEQVSIIVDEKIEVRSKKIEDKIYVRLLRENPEVEAIKKILSEPDFHYAKLQVQKEYARTGDDELGDLLIDLLIDRSKEDNRSLKQIVLNEALITAPKLTENQLAALAVLFGLRRTIRSAIENDDLLSQYLDTYVAPFIPKLVKTSSCYEHLEYCGCGKINNTQMDLSNVLARHCPTIFMNGFDKAEITDRSISIGYDERFFMPCIDDSSKIQLRIKTTLHKAFDEYSIDINDRKKLTVLYSNTKMTHNQIRDKCIKIRPYMSTLFEIWSESAIKNFSLTTVGIAIGHANIKRLVGKFTDLSIWIN